MTILFRILRAFTPPLVRRRGLEVLFRSTASAFGRRIPAGSELPFERRLAQYARFTHEESLKSLLSADGGKEKKDRLFQSGQAIGRRLRKKFGVSSPGDAVEAMRVLYRSLDIEIRSPAPGRLTVGRCFFSRYYSPDSCGMVSSLDDGVYAGLSGGGRLRFTARITEGSLCCRAETAPGEDGI